MIGSFLYKKFPKFGIKCRNAAQQLAQTVIDTPNDSVIIASPGSLEPLVGEFLSQNLNSLIICDPQIDKRNNYESNCLLKKSKSNFHTFSDDLEALQANLNCNEAREKCSEVMKISLMGMDKLKPGAVKLLLPLRPYKYDVYPLNQIYTNTALKSGLYANETFPHYYMYLNTRRTAMLKSKSSNQDKKLYRPMSVTMNTLFEIDSLIKFDLLQTFQIKPNRIHSLKTMSDSDIHLVRFKPRLRLLSETPPESFIEYRFFVQQLLWKPSASILSRIDNFFALDEDILIKNIGINKDTRAADLDYLTYWKLFCYTKAAANKSYSNFFQAYRRDKTFMMSQVD